MRNIFLGLILILLLSTVGCSQEKNQDYFSDREGEYKLFIITDSPLQTNFFNEFSNLQTVHTWDSLVVAEDLYSDLLDEINEIPIFLLYDTDSLVIKTNSEQEMVSYLEKLNG